MSEYEIDLSTIMLKANGSNTIIYDIEGEKNCNLKINKIVDNSCKFFGSSLVGRQDASKNWLHSLAKVPIVIDEMREIIFFPTTSTRNTDCIWISYNNLVKYEKIECNCTRLFFKNKRVIDIDVSFYIIDNQVTRCIKLERFLIKRKNEF